MQIPCKGWAASLNTVSRVDSLFWWQYKVDLAQDGLLIIKTKASILNQIVNLVNEHHSYDTPEIIALSIVCGNQDYLQWIGKEVKQSAGGA